MANKRKSNQYVNQLWEKDRDKQEQEKLNQIKLSLLLTNLPKRIFLKNKPSITENLFAIERAASKNQKSSKTNSLFSVTKERNMDWDGGMLKNLLKLYKKIYLIQKQLYCPI